MKLPRPFYRLPVRFDAERLREEVLAMPADAWVAHPNEIEGNSSVRLISVDGGENDEVVGRMRPTRHLMAAPYMRQVLASFAVVWSRSRLMRIAPGAAVPAHADINHHWFWRARVHIPVLTHADVAFFCGEERVHMAPGEAWIFDNWRQHRVENASAQERVHLVADTSGTASFWRLVAQSALPATHWHEHRFDPGREAQPMTEDSPPAPIMPPGELELLLADLAGELVPADQGPVTPAAVARYRLLLEEFCHDWRQLCAFHGASGRNGRDAFLAAAESLRAGSREIGSHLVMRTNGVEAHRVMEARVLRHLVHPVAHVSAPGSPSLDAPVFIIAAPRSGSTLLFETLAAHGAFATLGGEAHWLVESLPELCFGAAGIDSNRLTAAAATPAVETKIRKAVIERLRDSRGRPVGDQRLVFLEKTPKNALRIPFFKRLFPGSRFIFLWREPAENISSIIEAWRSGGWVTYPQLPGWDGPWSMLLPPQWQMMRGRPLEAVAAWQWDSVNRIACDDLAALPGRDWTILRYADLMRDAPDTLHRLCGFLGLEVDAALKARLAQPLPLSRYTHTPPAAEKWRKNADLLEHVLPAVECTRQRLEQLQIQLSNRYA